MAYSPNDVKKADKIISLFSDLSQGHQVNILSRLNRVMISSSGGTIETQL